MYDYEIVLGKLVGSLLPLAALLLTTVPILSMLLLLGGIDPSQVIQGALVLGASAFAAGSLGGVIALWRERTFQALALSVLCLVLYFCLSQGVGILGPYLSQEVNWNVVQAWLDPFIVMQSVLSPPASGWSGIPPAYGFTFVMLVWCLLLNGLGIWKLRKWNPSGEPIMQREKQAADPEAGLNSEELSTFRAKAHAAPGAVREVGDNPILWREIKTLAYGRRPLLVKLAYGLVLALIVYFAYSELRQPGGRAAYAAAYGLVPVTVLSMLLISAQAVTSITSERDGGALDILLVTDVSPYEFVFGKILGVIYNTWQFIVPPILMAAFYAFEGVLTKTPDTLSMGARFATNFAPMLTVIGAILLLFSFALVLGLHVALRLTNSRMAIINTLGTVFFLSVGTLICIYLILINGGSFANQWLSFISVLVLGIGGLLWVLSADRPSSAITIGSTLCPLAMFYCVTNILIAKPGTNESADPLVPFVSLTVAFGFTIAAMLVPLLSEFDVALGRTTAANEE